MTDDFAAAVSGVGSLAEPARRALYLFVAAQSEPVSREQAATGVGVAVHSAKFHLDRLVDEGLLEVEFRRLSGRSGPGAGRPAKLYRRAAREVSVSLPERRYDLAGHVLASAVDRARRGDVVLPDAVREAAEAEGRRLAGEAPVPEGVDDVRRTSEALAYCGYEPRVVDGDICLANCPFDALAREHTELVCGMNVALIEGVVTELGTALHPRLEPEAGLCCVKVGAAPAEP